MLRLLLKGPRSRTKQGLLGYYIRAWKAGTGIRKVLSKGHRYLCRQVHQPSILNQPLSNQQLTNVDTYDDARLQSQFNPSLMYPYVTRTLALRSKGATCPPMPVHPNVCWTGTDICLISAVHQRGGIPGIWRGVRLVQKDPTVGDLMAKFSQLCLHFVLLSGVG